MVNLSYSSMLVTVSLFALLIYIFSASCSLLINKGNKHNLLFICMNVAMAVWSFSFMLFFNSPDKNSAMIWYRVASVGYCTYYAFALHFSLLVLMNSSWYIKKIVLGLIYFSCIPFICLFFTNDLSFISFYTSRGVWFFSINSIEPWFIMYLLVSVLPLFITLLPFYNCIRKTVSKRPKKKYIIIFTTQLIALILGVISNIIFPIFSLAIIPPIANILILVYTLGLSYLIKSHRLIYLTPAIAANQIISKVIDMIVLTDSDGSIVEINESLKRTLDYTDDDLLGKKVDSIFSNTNLFSPEVNLNASDINIIGFSIISKLNTHIPVRLTISKICDEDNVPLGSVYILQDMRMVAQLREQISEKESLAESLTKKNDQLKDLDRLKSDFLCNVSHELRTPLSLMLSSLKLSSYNLQKENGVIEPRNVFRHFEIMNQNCYRLTKIINNIIDITKIDAGYFGLKVSNYNIVNIAEEVTLSAAEYAQKKGITFVFDTEMEEIVVACDAEIIERIILNLISNAVKFTNIGGEIFVKVSLKGNSVLISIKDNGIGISEDKQQLIFERFIQVDKSLSRLCEGSGIGLALVKLLVGLHQGTISVESEPNMGSTFTIVLPVCIVEDGNPCATPQFEYLQSLKEKVNIEFSDVYM